MKSETKLFGSTAGRGGLILVGLLFLIGAAALTAVLFESRSATPTSAAPVKPLLVGYQKSPAMALIMVAQDQGYFKDATGHQQIELKEFEAGKLALQAFLGKSLDVAVAGDVPIGLALLQGQKLTAFAEVIKGSRDEIRMVVRASQPCPSAESYFRTKRRIATSFGGGPQYFTESFIVKNAILPANVETLPFKPTEMPNAVDSEAVDGAAIFDPAAAKIERELGSAGCTFPDPLNYRQHYIAVARPEMFGGAPDPRLKFFVAGLKRAEAYIAQNPDKALLIVQRGTQIDHEILVKQWGLLKFGVVLDETLPNLWAQESIFFRRQPGGTFLAEDPKFSSVLNDELVK